MITTRSSTNIESEGKEERDDDTSNTNQASGNSDTSPVTTSECKVKPKRKKLSDHQAVLNKIDEELERAREENEEMHVKVTKNFQHTECVLDCTSRTRQTIIENSFGVVIKGPARERSHQVWPQRKCLISNKDKWLFRYLRLWKVYVT